MDFPLLHWTKQKPHIYIGQQLISLKINSMMSIHSFLFVQVCVLQRTRKYKEKKKKQNVNFYENIKNKNYICNDCDAWKIACNVSYFDCRFID